MTEADLDVLRCEFTGGVLHPDSFMMQLRPNLTWDKEAFAKLVTAMEACCKACEGQASLERWLVQGFWFVSRFVKHWTEHPNFPRPEPQEYHKKALERLDDLAYWFFNGNSPYEEGLGFDPL
jgi:hypothetical protein